MTGWANAIAPTAKPLRGWVAAVASYGIMSTSALVINEKVVSMGKVMKSGDVVKLMRKIGY